VRRLHWCKVAACRATKLQAALSILLVIASGHGFAQSAGSSPGQYPIPKQIEGEWRVKSVLVDLGSGRTMEYQRDDPRLVGRSFRFEPASIVNNAPEARECAEPRFLHKSLQLSKLVTLTFAARGDPGSPPGPRDFELPVSGDPLLDVVSVECQSGRFGPRALKTARKTLGSESVGTWVTRLPDDQLAIRWFDETILILHRAMH
jgi:hypothetical protein